MCDCHSYNKAAGSKPEVILTPPEHFGMTRADGSKQDSICIDACIAHVIQHLWDNDQPTLNCCCGHGKRSPSIILPESSGGATARRVRRLIEQVDQRSFELMSWNLIAV